MKSFDLVLKGGTIVTPDRARPGDIGISDGRIAAVGLPGSLGNSAHVEDVSGLHLLPGLVDPPGLSCARVLTFWFYTGIQLGQGANELVSMDGRTFPMRAAPGGRASGAGGGDGGGAIGASGARGEASEVATGHGAGG